MSPTGEQRNVAKTLVLCFYMTNLPVISPCAVNPPMMRLPAANLPTISPCVVNPRMATTSTHSLSNLDRFIVSLYLLSILMTNKLCKTNSTTNRLTRDRKISACKILRTTGEVHVSPKRRFRLFGRLLRKHHHVRVDSATLGAHRETPGVFPALASGMPMGVQCTVFGHCYTLQRTCFDG